MRMLISMKSMAGLTGMLVISAVTVCGMVPDDFNLADHLPAGWASICEVQLLRDDFDVGHRIFCHVTSDDAVLWRLADLRTSLQPLVDGMQLTVEVDIKCQTGGSISLPFPMRAPGLVRLRVDNCRLLDKLGDFGTAALQLNDSLRELDMRDCTWVNQPGALEHMLANLDSIDSHYECGQDSTLVSQIYRNISDEVNGMFNTDGGLLGDGDGAGSDVSGLLNETGGLGNFLGNGTDHVTGETNRSSEPLGVLTDIVDQLKTSCNFEKLELLDESFAPLTIKQHFEMMVRDSKFPALRVMRYSAIGLTDVPRELREWRRFFPQLRTLDLSRNYIREVGEILPYEYDIPMVMDLRYNNITSFSLKMFRDWAKVPAFRVDIRGNPVDCNCGEFAEFLRDFQDEATWLGEERGRAAMEAYRDQLALVTCVTPASLRGRTLSSLVRDDLPCVAVAADLRAAMAVLCVVAVVLLVLLVLAVRYRREVRILVFTRVHVLLPCGRPRALGSETAGKQFDAFVAYAHQDSEWVLGQLMPKLEAPTSRACGPCKLCVHQRDFVAGKPIIDNIIDSIAASRHTIVVVSSSFVKSAWAMEELQQAYRQSLEERRRHLVLVVLEDVPQTDMAPVLRRCCKTFTYLNVSDALFWDRLFYSIHVTADNNSSKLKQTSKGTSASNYDNIGFETNKDTNLAPKDVESGLDEGLQDPVDEEFRRAVFLETMRTISIDSTCTTASTASDERNLVSAA